MHVHACALVCARAGARQAPLACRAPVFALHLPCAFQGTCGIWQPGTGALRGQGGVLLNTRLHLRLRFFDAEKGRAFDVWVRACVLCGCFTRAV